MAWPPPVLATTRANATVSVDTHPGDHNALAQAINDTVAYVKPEAWQALPFAANFSNLGGNQACQFRKVGDMVQLRGAGAYSGSTSGVPVATLPVGYRPPNNVDYPVLGNLAIARFSITAATGVIQYVRIEAQTAGNLNFFYLNQIAFSLAP